VLPRTWSNPQLSSHIRIGLEPPRLQQATFDDCFYSVDVMRNVAVKKQASDDGATSGGSLVKVDTDEVERKFSLPARMLCQTTTEVMDSKVREDSPQPQAVAGRLEIRMLDPSCQLQSECNDRNNSQALYLATTPAAEPLADKNFTSLTAHNTVPGFVKDSFSVFYDAQTAKDEATLQIHRKDNTCTIINEADAINVKTSIERLNDDENESFHSPAATSIIRGSKSPQQQRRKGTVVPPIPPHLEMASNYSEEGEEVEGSTEQHFSKGQLAEDSEGHKPFPDYQVLSEQTDDEHRKISIINLNDLSKAFHASSRIRTPRPSPPPEDAESNTAEQSDERSLPSKYVSEYLSNTRTRAVEGEGEGEATACESTTEREQADDEFPNCRRKRQGVEKYISDNSQLNLQFERRRSYRPHSSDVSGVSGLHHSPTLRQRSSIAMMPDSYTSQQSYLESRARPSLQVSPSNSSLNRLEVSYDISRVRSSPSLAPSAGRFPFHYTPNLPSGTPPTPTLRELDAR